MIVYKLIKYYYKEFNKVINHNFLNKELFMMVT
jgi:hypothetical protein